MSILKGEAQNPTPIAKCVKNGLQALEGNHSRLIIPQNSRLLKESVFLDQCLPDGRWDYLINYDDQISAVEVHPASTAEVNRMIEKVKWLKSLLNQMPAVKNSLRKNKEFVWIASGNIKITATSPQARRLASSGIKPPQKNLRLP